MNEHGDLVGMSSEVDTGASHTCYTRSMDEIPSRELRNDVASVLRRVESGQSLRITIRGRPVADLVPIGNRPSTMAWTRFRSALGSAQADVGLGEELRDALAGSTDDVAAG